MKYVGYLLIAFGIADFVLSYSGTDIWGEVIGVQLPDLIWQYSGMIEIALGYGIVTLLGKSDSDTSIQEG